MSWPGEKVGTSDRVAVRVKRMAEGIVGGEPKGAVPVGEEEGKGKKKKR